MDKRYADLFEQAEAGTLSEDAVAKLVEELQEPTAETDRYSILYILGETRNLALAPVIEPFLHDPDHKLAEKAFRVLCINFGLEKRYSKEILRYLRGVSWDRYGDVRMSAASIAGWYLQANSDAAVLAELLRILEDRSEGGVLRSVAYESLVQATGGDWYQVSKDALSLRYDVDVSMDPAVIAKAKERLAKEDS